MSDEYEYLKGLDYPELAEAVRNRISLTYEGLPADVVHLLADRLEAAADELAELRVS